MNANSIIIYYRNTLQQPLLVSFSRRFLAMKTQYYQIKIVVKCTASRVSHHFTVKLAIYLHRHYVLVFQSLDRRHAVTNYCDYSDYYYYY